MTATAMETMVLKMVAKTGNVVHASSEDHHASHATAKMLTAAINRAMVKATRMGKKVADHHEDASTANQKPAVPIR